MRFNGEILLKNIDEKENETNFEPFSIAGTLPSQNQQKIVVGYALTLKKMKSFLQPKLESLAR